MFADFQFCVELQNADRNSRTAMQFRQSKLGTQYYLLKNQENLCRDVWSQTLFLYTHWLPASNME